MRSPLDCDVSVTATTSDVRAAFAKSDPAHEAVVRHTNHHVSIGPSLMLALSFSQFDPSLPSLRLRNLTAYVCCRSDTVATD
jgi:hypothetical protein